MIPIHPFIKSMPIGIAAFCVLQSVGFPDAAFVATATWVATSVRFRRDEQAYEAKLMHRKRLYDLPAEQAFADIQRALANVWLSESHWEVRMADMPNGFMLYRFEWREPESLFDDGKVRHHANLEIALSDRSNAEGVKTLVTYNFDGLPNVVDKRTFYQAIHLAMEAVDQHLPEYSVAQASATEVQDSGASSTQSH